MKILSLKNWVSLMGNESSSYKQNRKKELKEQFNYWSANIESGVIRFCERVLLGFNTSDILGGDLGQIEHLQEVKKQVKERRLIEGPILQVPPSGEKLYPHEATSAQFIFNIKNARVDVLTGLVVLDAGFVVDSTLAKWQKILYRGGIGSSIKRTKRSKKKIAGSYMVLPHSPFYYHTLIDEIPNLIRLRDVYPQCNNVITHELTPSWALELLNHFNFEVCTLGEKAVVVENLFAVSAPRAIVQKNLELLRRGINMSPDKIVVVSRKGAPRSDNDIEKEILSRVSGSILVDPSDFSVEEQVEIFSNARIIIGLHGGALTNCVWMDTSGEVIEIFNHAYRTTDYERLCTELRIRYVGVETENLSSAEVSSIVARLINDSSE